MKQTGTSLRDIQPYLCCQIGQILLGIPTSQVWMIMEGATIERITAAPKCLTGKISFYKGDTPVVDPVQLLPVPYPEIFPEESTILMMNHGQTDFFGFPVDHIRDIHKFEKKQFLAEDQASGLGFSSGIVGRVRLDEQTIHIIDTSHLLSRETLKQCHDALSK